MIKERALNNGQLRLSSSIPNGRVEILRKRLNDENYIHGAIQRLALIMSRQLMEITKEGDCYEQQRKRR